MLLMLPINCLLKFNLTYPPSESQDIVAVVESVKSSESSVVCGLTRKLQHELMDELSSLMKRTHLYLQETRCAMKHVVTCIMDVRHIKCVSNESPLKDVVTATNITDVMSGLTSKHVITFEHFSTVKRIIFTLCSKSEDLQKKLRVYEDKFRRFSQGKVLESVKFNDEKPCSNVSKDMVELIITADSSWNVGPTFNKVLELEDTIANAFQCESFALHVRSIDHEPHSWRLSFAISPTTLKSVFPLTAEEWSSITKCGVVELKCYEFHYIVQERGM